MYENMVRVKCVRKVYINITLAMCYMYERITWEVCHVCVCVGAVRRNVLMSMRDLWVLYKRSGYQDERDIRIV